jgi:hypothetical protein
MTAGEKKLSLPPFCEGKSYGSLKLIFEEINWNKFEISSIERLFRVNVLWWGQRQGAEVTTRNSSKSALAIEYQIKTSPSLFQSYLWNCEPIIIKFYSHSGSLIGSSKVNIGQTSVSSGILKKSSHIFYLGKLVGNIVLSLQVPKMIVSRPFKYPDFNSRSKNRDYLKSLKIEENLPDLRIERTVERTIITKKEKPEQEQDVRQFIKVHILSTEFDNCAHQLHGNCSQYSLKCAITSKMFWKNEEIKLHSAVLSTTKTGFRKYQQTN